MTEKKKETEKAPTHLKVKLTLRGGPGAKVFTSLGPLVRGSVCELPAAEAQVLIDRDQAHISAKEVEHIEPTVNVEKDFK